MRIFLLFTLALIAIELLHDTYRWFVFTEERAELRVLGATVDSVGTLVVKTQLQADSLRIRIETMDEVLETSRSGFDVYDRAVGRGTVRSEAYASYRRRVAAYNQRVAERNSWFGAWQGAIARNRDAVRRYNELAEEIRTLAATIGELHYNIPSPVEAAVRTGLQPH